MTTYSLEDLKEMTPEQRAALYQNAARLRENGGQAIIDLIDSSGLSLSSGGMRSDDPTYLKMEEIIGLPKDARPRSKQRKAAFRPLPVSIHLLAMN